MKKKIQYRPLTPEEKADQKADNLLVYIVSIAFIVLGVIGCFKFSAKAGLILFALSVVVALFGIRHREKIRTDYYDRW